MEEKDDENDRDYNENNDVLTERSDIPSPPSTPSPQPKSRGRMNYRGQGRGQVKISDANSVIETRRQTAVRRGSRRRTTRFKLDPDDNSDFEEMLEELETGGRRETSGGSVNTPKDATDGKTSQEHSQEPQVNRVDRSSPLITMVGARGRLGHRAELAYSNVGYRTGKMVSRAQNTDPDIFEFQEGQECVVEGKVEAGEAVALKHASPCVFPEEELSQGGRDVNENVGAISEAASA